MWGLAPTCGRVLVAEHDGGVYSCDHFVTPEHRSGDLASANLGDLVDTPVQHRFGQDKLERLPGQCRSCPWLTVCNGGCPKDRFAVSHQGEQGLNFLCAGYKLIYAHT